MPMNEASQRDGGTVFMRVRPWVKIATIAGAVALVAAVPLVGRAIVVPAEQNDEIPGVALPATQPVTGSVTASTSDADDVYALRVPAGRWLWARTTAAAGTDVDLYLFGATAKSVRSTTPAVAFSERQGTSFEFIRYRASVDTTAYVDVAAYADKATYELRYGMPSEEIVVSAKAPTTFAWGGSATISGTVKRSATGTAVPAGEYVYLMYRPYGAARYTVQTRTQTDADGNYEFEVKPSKRTYYQVRHLGSSRFVAPLDPAGLTITPSAALGDPRVPSTVTRNTSFVAYGYLRPRHTAGAKSVQVRCYQLQPDGTYLFKTAAAATNYDYSTSTGTITKYKATVSVPSAGTWRFRAYIAGDSTHASTWSPGSVYRTVP
jgi:hypothetical protein